MTALSLIEWAGSWCSHANAVPEGQTGFWQCIAPGNDKEAVAWVARKYVLKEN